MTTDILAQVTPDTNASGFPYPCDTLSLARQCGRKFDRLSTERDVLLQVLGIFEALEVILPAHAPAESRALGMSIAAAALARSLHHKVDEECDEADRCCIATHGRDEKRPPDLVWHYSEAMQFATKLSALAVLRAEIASDKWAETSAPIAVVGLLSAALHLLASSIDDAYNESETYFEYMMQRSAVVGGAI